MKKYEEIAEMIKRRILHEDYTVNRFPGIRKLAEDTGVSYLTARQALLKLVNDGTLIQKENSYFSINEKWKQQKSPSGFKVAFLTHHRASDYFVWENAVAAAAEKLNVSFRQFYYIHDDDPFIAEVLGGDFDLVFFKHAVVGHKFVENMVIKHADKVVTLFQDMTKFGVRCFDGSPPSETAKLAEYLYELGHRRFATVRMKVDYSSPAEAKIIAWNQFLKGRGIQSALYEINSHHLGYTLIPAYEQAGKIIFAPERPTAVFCSNLTLAIGLIRFCHDHQVKVGEDISVCSFGEPEMARMHIPSITVIDRPPPVNEAMMIIRDAMDNRGRKEKRLMYCPEAGNLIIGESTGVPVL